jgi:hypothetical protein
MQPEIRAATKASLVSHLLKRRWKPLAVANILLTAIEVVANRTLARNRMRRGIGDSGEIAFRRTTHDFLCFPGQKLANKGTAQSLKRIWVCL